MTTKRDETRPRVSDIIKFLYEEELNAIPKHILEAAAQRGTEKHAIIESNYGKNTDNIISQLFRDGLFKIFTEDELQCDAVFEEQLNGKRFTGKPDFRLRDTLIDYKFANDLRTVTALQLILYSKLVTELHDLFMQKWYVFHFPKDHGLFIYKIADKAILPILKYAESIINNHEAIKSGGLERYDALLEWEKLQQDYEIFELVETVLPPLTITNEEEAENAAVIYYNIKAVIEREAVLKRELKQYMEEQGITKIEDINGYGIRLQGRKNKMYDADRKAAAKKIYDKALNECQTGVFETTSLVRFAPRKKKEKQIN
jgi:hypothetical protein